MTASPMLLTPATLLTEGFASWEKAATPGIVVVAMGGHDGAALATDTLRRAVDWLRSPARLSVAVIDGRCADAELALALACDCAVATPTSYVDFSTPTSTIPLGGEIEVLVARVGASRALGVLAQGQVAAVDAHGMGLIDSLEPAEIVIARIADLVNRQGTPWWAEIKGLVQTASAATMDRERGRRLVDEAAARIASEAAEYEEF